VAAAIDGGLWSADVESLPGRPRRSPETASDEKRGYEAIRSAAIMADEFIQQRIAVHAGSAGLRRCVAEACAASGAGVLDLAVILRSWSEARPAGLGTT